MASTELRRLAAILALITLAVAACEQERAEVREPEPPQEQPAAEASGESGSPGLPEQPGDQPPGSVATPPEATPDDHAPTGDALPTNDTFLRTEPLPELEIAVPDPSADAFRALVRDRLVDATGLYVDDWWGARLGGPDAAPAWIARLCVDGDDAWHHNWFLVLTSNGSLHVVPFRAQSRAVCAGNTAPNQGLDKALEVRDETVLELFDSDLYGRFDKRHIVEREGRLVVAREASSPGAGPTGTEVHEQRIDWEHGWFEARIRAVRAGDPTTPSADDIVFSDAPSHDAPRAGALVMVQRDPDDDLPTWTHVTGALGGPDDAALHVIATANTAPGAQVTDKPETTITLTLRLQDDAPTPDDEVHVTWCARPGDCTATAMRTLVIQPNTGDSPTVGWLESDKSLAPPPVTRTDDGRLTLKLPLVALTPEPPDDALHTPTARSYPLTVQLTDHDPDEPTPTRLSTAMLADAPSRLVALPHQTRMPQAGQPLGKDDPIVTD